MTLALVILLVAAGTSPFAARPEAQNPDALNALLVEVKGLRTAMEQLASAGPRVQLLFGRLQLQEQRINAQVRRLDTLQTQLRAATGEESRQRIDVQRVEDFVRSHPGAPEGDEVPRMKKHLALLTAEAQRLQMEESNVLSLIAAEQNRWNDINRALDELDRALIRR